MNDDDYGALLLRPLAGEPTGPTRADLPRAMRMGRRMRHRRRWSGFAALFAALTAAVVAGGLALAPASTAPKPEPTLPPEPAVPAACTAGSLPVGGQPNPIVNGGV
jgi:hypothetical protein